MLVRNGNSMSLHAPIVAKLFLVLTRDCARSGLFGKFIENGAGRETRTPDPLITNQVLYQLSYTGGR